MEKRGLSNLVATVLIILLALAAVALVWSFLQPSFENTGVKIDLGTQCLNVDIKPLSCTNVTNSSGDINGSLVNVQYSNGDLSSVIAVVTWSDDTTTVATHTGTLSELATTPVYVPQTRAGLTPKSASVAAVVTDGVNDQTCPESATKVACDQE
jgi:hypothetical protein